MEREDGDTNLFDAVVQVSRSLKRLNSSNEKLTQRLAHSIQFDALGPDRVENHGTIGVVVHQFGGVTKERIGSIQVDLLLHIVKQREGLRKRSDIGKGRCTTCRTQYLAS
jgi:hypothetical protein